jgi:hypothetical protein
VEHPKEMEEKIKPAQGLQTSSHVERTKNPGDEAPARSGVEGETKKEKRGNRGLKGETYGNGGEVEQEEGMSEGKRGMNERERGRIET